MLRTPLLGPEEDVREERWIEVGQWPEPGASAQELHDEAEQRRLEQAIEAQKKIDQSNPFDTPFDRELAIAHPEAPERLKSLFVLDFMANSLRQSPVDPTGETMRLLARVQARAQLLTVAMRSVPEYVRCLQQCVAEETALAQHFKSANNKDAAIACLRRVKLMRSEIDAQQTTAPAPSPPPSAPKSEPSTKLPPVKVATAPPVQVAPSASVDHDSVDSIVSVAVIDFELGLVGSDEDGQLRKSELEIKRQMIIMAIEMGSLTAEEYAANLNKRIAADKQLAKMFNDRGDKAKALKMLKRAKLMENELAS